VILGAILMRQEQNVMGVVIVVVVAVVVVAVVVVVVVVVVNCFIYMTARFYSIAKAYSY